MTDAVRNHIHLSTDLGGAPENAPDLIWRTVDRNDIPNVVMSLRRSQSGKLHVHTLRDVDGPLLFQDYSYIIRVSAEGSDDVWERAAALKALLGRTVYLCDHYHAGDGEDHTANIRTMTLSRMGSLPVFDQTLRRFYVDIELTDSDTVP